MKKYFLRIMPIIFYALVIIFSGCGGESTSPESGSDGENTQNGSDSGDDGNTVNTDKLIGTPFEGLTAGDTLDLHLFLCGKYRTNTIDPSFPTTPIKIFTAFFTENGKNVSETEATDWAIIIDAGTAGSTGLTKTIAHELGHATGIQNHQLIDYVNDLHTGLIQVSPEATTSYMAKIQITPLYLVVT